MTTATLPSRSGPRVSVRVVGLILTAGIALIAAAILGRAFAGTPPPGDDSVAAGFARDMIVHHTQAVDMALAIQGRTDDPTLQALSTDIVLTQTNQIGQMTAALQSWQLPLARTGPAMGWMTDDEGMRMGGGEARDRVDPAMTKLLPDGRMPGMATQDQVNQLRTLPTPQAEVLFLQLMIAHHRGGIAMAQTASALTDDPLITRLADSIVASQQSEITAMTDMLAQRGATP